MKIIIIGLLLIGSISANALELNYPAWDVPFKAFSSVRKNKIEADKICLIHTDRKIKSKSFEIEELTQDELAKKFPGVLTIFIPVFCRSCKTLSLMSRILVEGRSLAVPDNAERAVMEPLIEQSLFNADNDVKIFKKINCE